MVMNTAYGPLESLPFDLRTRRIIPYRMPLENQDRATVRQQLERTIEGALRTILEQVVASLPNPPSLLDESLLSIQNASPNQTTLLRRYMDELVARLLVLAPDFTTEGANVERLLEALEQSKSIVAEFAHLTEQAAAMNSSAAINTIYRGFSGILNRYSVPNGYSGSCQTTGFDFYKFIGHELFVTLFLHLIQEERWESIADILEQGIYVENTYQHRPGTVSFEEISDSVELLDYHGRQPSVRRVSVHADMLNTRHGEGKLGDIAPMRQFMEADYFLFLRSEFQQSEPSQYLVGWRPWSMLYMGGQTPRYLVEATYKAQAQKLLRPLGVKDIDTLRLYLTERAPKIHKMFLHRTSGRPLVEINPEVIGTK